MIFIENLHCRFPKGCFCLDVEGFTIELTNPPHALAGESTGKSEPWGNRLATVGFFSTMQSNLQDLESATGSGL